VHPHRLEQLVASVPDGITAEQRTSLLAHVRASDGCRSRIERVRGELRRALQSDGDRALELACELDGLERVQQRVDGWLTALVDDLSRSREATRYNDGVPA
jgi:hypothetical protein